MLYEKELNIALNAVAKASHLCRNVSASLVSEDTLSKKDRSPVTVADYGAQAIVLSDLVEALDEETLLFVAEEDAGDLLKDENRDVLAKISQNVQAIKSDMSESDIIEAIQRGNHSGGEDRPFWTLDPIDGTKGFLRSGQYAVALALIEKGEVVLGVLGCPNMQIDPNDEGSQVGALFYAVRGQGAYMKALPMKGEPVSADFDNRINVSVSDDIASASFCESVESGHSSHDDAAKIAEMLGVKAPPVRMDSQCKYSAVARGQASIYLRLPVSSSYEEKIWDHAAGVVIVEEAGGKVTDIEGNPLVFSKGRTLKENKGVVATTSQYFQEVINAVRTVLQS